MKKFKSGLHHRGNPPKMTHNFNSAKYKIYSNYVEHGFHHVGCLIQNILHDGCSEEQQ